MLWLRGGSAPTVATSSVVLSPPVNEPSFFEPAMGTFWTLVIPALSLLVAITSLIIARKVYRRQRQKDLSAYVSLFTTGKPSPGRYHVELRNSGAQDARDVDVVFTAKSGAPVHPFVTTHSPFPVDIVGQSGHSPSFSVEADDDELKSMQLLVSWKDGRRGRQQNVQKLS